MREKLYSILIAPTETTKEIRDLMERMDTLAWSMIPGAIRYDAVRVQTSPQDRMAETMGDIDEAQRKLRQLDQRRRAEQERIRELCVQCLDLDERERYVIIKRYLHRNKWQNIFDGMALLFGEELTDRRIFQIHSSALDKLDAFLGP